MQAGPCHTHGEIHTPHLQVHVYGAVEAAGPARAHAILGHCGSSHLLGEAQPRGSGWKRLVGQAREVPWHAPCVGAWQRSPYMRAPAQLLLELKPLRVAEGSRTNGLQHLSLGAQRPSSLLSSLL